MSAEMARVGLLRRAFPRDPVTDRPTCAWDGRSRRAAQALCYKDWSSLSREERVRYMEMDIYDRAEWIIENAPGHPDTRGER